MSRSWLSPGATSSSSSAASGSWNLPTRIRSWLAAPRESQVHGSAVSSGAGGETHTHGWLATLSETARGSRAGAAGNETRSRSWLQPEACAQPTTNSSPSPKCVRAWTEPSATAQPQVRGSRSWLEPSATAESPVKRQRVLGAEVQCPECGTGAGHAKQQLPPPPASQKIPQISQ